MESLIGKRFGRLLVVGKAPSKHGYARWWCLCDCGKTKDVSGTGLNNRHTKSCGCLRREVCKQRALLNAQSNTLDIGVCARNLLYAVYRHNAEIRNREFSLTPEQFQDLTSSNSIYCGLEPSSVYKPNYKHGEYRYNGVDRVDNAQGYAMSNCVPCCKICNWMKRTQTSEEFIAACQRVIDYQNHKKSTEMLDSSK